MNILPYAYALLVFGVIAFLFVLLGRIFLNMETIFIYEFETIPRETVNNITFVSFVKITEAIKNRGAQGWKLETIQQDNQTHVLIFSKTKSKFKLF
jgi:hypothetical protein